MAAASFVYAIWFRWGASKKSGNLHQIGRLGYFGLIAVAFYLNDWPGGVAICIASGVIGQFAPALIKPLWVKPVSETPKSTLTPRSPVEPMGRRAVLRDMIQNGISREKVRSLIQQGKLVAYEDPKDGRISLVRPEDLASVQSLQSGDDEQN